MAELYSVDLGQGQLAAAEWAISQQLFKLTQAVPQVIYDIFGKHFQGLLKTGEMTKSVSSCLKYTVADVIKTGSQVGQPVPDIPSNQDLSIVYLRRKTALHMKQLVHGKWINLEKLYFCIAF